MAMFEQGAQVKYRSLGHFKAAVSTTDVPLPSIPPNHEHRVRRVVIRCRNAGICWRDDGTGAAIDGQYLLQDDLLVYDGESLDAFVMVRDSTATADADVRVAYYGV